ncbi:hypothetical protein ACE1ET_08095 [Saccharicrinis sp. FJH62]|uniref:hypothetical protein n=1 Tax=Saccharicrinis sp. FJH62 TaxID=3344657 RepID=UPI0035D4BF38
MKQIEFTREELYTKVWEEPINKFANRLNISDYIIRKRCKEFDIPLPPVGYWSKIKHGYCVTKTKLSTRTFDKPIILGLKEGNKVYSNETSMIKKKIKQELIDKLSSYIKVSSKLTNPHPRILSSKASLGQCYLYKGMYESGNNEFNVRVSKKNINRAYVLFNALLKILLKRNHEIISQYNNVFIRMYGEDIKLSIKEKMKIVYNDPNDYPSREFIPAGKLAVILGNYYTQKEWIDGKILLEDRILDIVTYLEYKTLKEKEERIQREIQRKKYEEIRKQEEELKQSRNLEILRFKGFINQVICWKISITMREYSKMHKLNVSPPNEENDFSIWVENKINWFDPLIKAPDDLLRDEERNELYKTLTEHEQKSVNKVFW